MDLKQISFDTKKKIFFNRENKEVLSKKLSTNKEIKKK